MRATTADRAKAENPILLAIRRSRSIFFGIGIFSGMINLLALTGAFYMLQVYDRVLPSGSVPTLVGLTILLAGLYLANGLLDIIRVRVMSRLGMRIDSDVRERVFEALYLQPLRVKASGDGLQPVRDLDTIRSFLSGMGPTALFDLPWIPVYLALVFALHPLLGLFALGGALVLIALTWATEKRTKGPMNSASRSGSERFALGEEARRNAEVIRALGLGKRMAAKWDAINVRHLEDQLSASDASSGLGTASKVLRLFLQSGILGLGAYLVIHGSVSSGAIIAASIITARALAPVETAIAHWRGFVAARQSYRRLISLFTSLDLQPPAAVVSLPKPQSTLTVQSISVAPPGVPWPTIQGVSFALRAGEALGVIGPSASGKSTLARALVGVWEPLWSPMRMGGSVRLDDASLDQWPPDELGRHIGYLPQDVSLFTGTIADNIARFTPDASSAAIVEAAKAAGVHSMIVQLPDGYQTVIGDGGTGLSAGQRQRIALARALIGNPFLVVLDEPNSNLDAAGDVALTEAIMSVRARGGIVVVIAHRPSALAAVDKILAIAGGKPQAFGPKDEVLNQVLHQPVPAAEPHRPAAAAGASAAGGRQPWAAGLNLKVVTDQNTAGRS